MANRLAKEVLYRFSPGQQAAPARAAYTRRFLPISYSSYLVTFWLTEAARLGATVTRIPGTPGRYEEIIISYPPTPAVPYIAPSLYVDTRAGWNASGESFYAGTENFSFTFDYARYPNAGVMVGVATRRAEGTTPATLKAAVFVRDGYIEVLRDGYLLGTAPYTPSDKPQISLLRVGSSVLVRVGAWSYLVDAGLTGSAFIRSLLYVAGDYVDNPSLGFPQAVSVVSRVGFRDVVPDFARARGRLGVRLVNFKSKGRVAFRCFASAIVDTQGRAEGRVGFKAIVTPPGGEAVLSMPRMTVFGGAGAGGIGRAVLSRLAVAADGGFYIVPGGGGVLALPGLQVSGYGLVGAVASGTLQLPRLHLIGADEPYGSGMVALPAMSVVGHAPSFADGQADLLINIGMLQTYQAQYSLFATLIEQVSVSAQFSITALFSEGYIDGISILDTADVVSFLSAAIIERVSLSDAIARMQLQAIQYATNVLTGAVTRFEGFDFVGFANVGMGTYAAAEDGIYKVTHNNKPLSAAIEFASIGLDSGNLKLLEYVYLGIDTDGETYVRVTGDDKKERVYKAIGRSGMRRGQPAKGVKSRSWDIRLEIVDATVAELDRIEWAMPVATRRHGR